MARVILAPVLGVFVSQLLLSIFSTAHPGVAAVTISPLHPTIQPDPSALEEEKKNAKSPLELLRELTAPFGVRGLVRTFNIMDDDESRDISYMEFEKGVQDWGLKMAKQQIEALFGDIDKSGSGSLQFDEFLIALRPPISDSRKSLIKKAFQKLDKSGDGVVTVDDLKRVYDANKCRKFLSGEWTEDQCLRQVLDNFDSPKDKDGQISEDQFMDYYFGASAFITDDAVFRRLMKNAWKI